MNFVNVSRIFNVSAKNISKVVTSVLSILGKFDVTENDFPKSTFCKLVRQEANRLSSRQIGEELLTLRMLLSTAMALVVMAKRWLTMESGATRTIGLVDVAGGAAETQLDASAVL